uniref:NDT80 domain-containing protein n=1 Tax=Caenorhabditis tropicalis TaxID=1561998 RepID=A0A1I7TNG9_9PELO
MARELNSLFMPNPPMDSRCTIFSLQDFPPISAPAPNPLFAPQPHPNHAPFEKDRRMPNYQTYNSQGMQGNYVGRPVQPLMDAPAKPFQGYGCLSWLSSKGGLLTTADNKSISFQAKVFCEETQNDLLQVLRVGFTLKYTAIHHEANQFTATEVVPVYGEEADRIFKNAIEIDLEKADPTPANSKDAYSLVLEKNSYSALLGTFERQGMYKVQLSSLHSQMSNYGDDKLFRYVGTSSMKRRQFVERRTHIFHLQNDDSITLQYPAVYQLIVLLSSFLLRRGGVASIQCLFNYYTSNDVHQSIKDFFGYDRQVFMNLLTTHNFVFAMFPNRSFVSARRNLPDFDYIGFVNQYFPALMTAQQQNGFAAQNQQLQRSVSLPIRDSYGMNGRGPQQNYRMQQQPQRQYQAPPSLMSTTHPVSFIDPRMTSPPTDDWNLVSSASTWSSQTSNVTRQPSCENTTISLDIFNDNTLTSEFGNLNLLRQNDSDKTSSAVQVDEPIGKLNCTCKCTCGRAGSNNVGAIGSSRGLPTILPGVSNFGPMAPIGTRPSSNSTSSSEEQPKFSESYNLFGSNDILSGSLDSLRFGNL